MAIRLRELNTRSAADDTAPEWDDPATRSSTRTKRLGRRGLRACTGVAIYIGVVIVLLTSIYHWHESRPRSVLDLGWQNMQQVYVPPEKSTATQAATADLPAAVDTAEAGPAAPAFPPDRYLPLLPNKAPLVDLEVQVCYWGLPCEPPARDDNPHGLFGPWVRVERHVDSLLAENEGRINKQADSDPASSTPPGKSSLLDALGSMFPFPFGGAAGGGAVNQLSSAIEQKWIFYRRSKVDTFKSPQRIVDVHLVQKGDRIPLAQEGWVPTKRDLRSRWMAGVKLANGQKQGPAYLFYRLDTSGAGNETQLPSLTELDIIYGDNDPLPGFSLVSTPILPDAPTSHTVGSTLAVRREPATPPEVPTPITFRPDGTFKVLQLADLHYSLSRLACRDADPTQTWINGTCIGEDETELRVGKWLDDENPDLVVLSGDQINGQGTSWDERSTIMRVIRPMVQRKILWTAIGGNHDSQSGILSRAELQSLYRQLPYSKTFAGPSALDDGTEMFGSANFYLYLHSPHADQTHLASLYFMDSGAHVPLSKDRPATWKPSWMGGGSPTVQLNYSSQYGYIHPSQISWFDRLSASVKPLVHPYHPDTGHDLPPLWPPESGVNTVRYGFEHRPASARAEVLRKPPAIMFQHIPVPEAFNGTLDKDARGKDLVYGARKETNGMAGAQARAGFFDLLRTQSLNQTRDIQVLAHGHMHLNADCRRIEGVWICFAGGSSLAGYGDPGFLRRARVFLLDRWGERISTHQVYEDGSKDDSHVLYEI